MTSVIFVVYPLRFASFLGTDKAKNLKMKVIAEGVEDKAEGDRLREMGCENAQGYFYARPMPEKEVMALIYNWDRSAM